MNSITDKILALNSNLQILTENVEQLKPYDDITFKCNLHNSMYTKKLYYILDGYHCDMCKAEEQRLIKQNKFITKSKEIHNNKFDYSKVHYIDQDTKVIIICPIDGEFLQSPKSHLKGRGCKKCSWRENGKSRAFTVDFMLEQLTIKYSTKYTYDFTGVTTANDKIKVTCSECGTIFCSEYSSLMRLTYGCPTCAIKYKSLKKRTTLPAITDLDEIKNYLTELHNGKYLYNRLTTTDINEDAEIFCTECNVYYIQNLGAHLRGTGHRDCCFIERDAKHRLQEEDITNRIISLLEYKFTIIDISNYKDKNSLLTLQCNRCKSIVETSLNNIESKKRDLCITCHKSQTISYRTQNNQKWNKLYFNHIENITKDITIDRFYLETNYKKHYLFKHYFKKVSQHDDYLEDFLYHNPESNLNNLYGIIYRAKNLINGNVYVGQTLHKLTTRMKGHKRGSKSENIVAFSNAINKYGWDNFDWKIVELTYSIDDMNEKEIKWVAYYDSMCNKGKGYNVALPGNNSGNAFAGMTEEQLNIVKLNMSKSNKGRTSWSKGLTKETSSSLMTISNKAKNRKQSEKTIALRVSKTTGKKRTEETKAKMSLSGKGREKSEETKKLLSIASSKKVVCITTNELFSSLKEACLYYHTNNISKSIKNNTTSGKHPQTKQPLTWEYYNSDLHINLKLIK